MSSLGLDKFCSRWWDAHNLHIKVFQQMKKPLTLKLVNYSSTGISTTNPISRAAGPLDPHLEKCKCISRKISSYFRELFMNYVCKQIEVLTLPFKYRTIRKNFLQMNSVICPDLIHGSTMQPKDHWLILIGYSSCHCATLYFFLQLKFRINLQMLKKMIYKICLCCRLTNIQTYQWAVKFLIPWTTLVLAIQ